MRWRRWRGKNVAQCRAADAGGYRHRLRAGLPHFRRILPNWCVERPALVKLAERLFARESFARTSPP